MIILHTTNQFITKFFLELKKKYYLLLTTHYVKSLRHSVSQILNVINFMTFSLLFSNRFYNIYKLKKHKIHGLLHVNYFLNLLNISQIRRISKRIKSIYKIPLCSENIKSLSEIIFKQLEFVYL